MLLFFFFSSFFLRQDSVYHHLGKWGWLRWYNSYTGFKGYNAQKAQVLLWKKIASCLLRKWFACKWDAFFLKKCVLRCLNDQTDFQNTLSQQMKELDYRLSFRSVWVRCFLPLVWQKEGTVGGNANSNADYYSKHLRWSVCS